MSCLLSYINSSIVNNYTKSPSEVVSPEASEMSFLGKFVYHLKPQNGGHRETNSTAYSHFRKTGVDGDAQIIEHGPRNKKVVALTFDADMTPGMLHYLHSGEVSTYDDRRITDFLIKHNIKATLFLTGMWIEAYPEETKAFAANPLFELANHSYSHPSFVGNCFGLPSVPAAQYRFEIEKTKQLLQEVAKVKPKYFRFPGGCYNQADLDLVTKEGLKTVHWDTVADDGFNTNAEQIINNVLSATKNGSIIVMHIGGSPNTPKTAEALQTITARLKQNGFEFVTVSELLQPPPIAKKVDLKKYLLSLNFPN